MKKLILIFHFSLFVFHFTLARQGTIQLTVTYQFTGLKWATDANLVATRNPTFDKDRKSGNEDVNWKTALDYIQLLNNENYPGCNKWRLPDVNEFLSKYYAHSNMVLPLAHLEGLKQRK